jgi:hypothetical protein
MGSGIMTALITTNALVDQFLAKAEKEPIQRKRLNFAIDATASRQPTWDAAAQVQGQMFLVVIGHHSDLVPEDLRKTAVPQDCDNCKTKTYTETYYPLDVPVICNV